MYKDLFSIVVDRAGLLIWDGRLRYTVNRGDIVDIYIDANVKMSLKRYMETCNRELLLKYFEEDEIDKMMDVWNKNFEYYKSDFIINPKYLS